MSANHEILDYIGIGFGPANLSLAVTISEEWSGANGLFFDDKQEFSWHRDMMIGNVSMQVPFLKDLATMRNPCSRFSFVNYLKERNRLEHFINLRSFYPTRVEYNDYLCWAAAEFGDIVQFGKRVVQISPVFDVHDGKVLRIIAKDLKSGSEQSYLTRNIILAPGGTPSLPDNIQKDSPKIIHSARYLSSMAAAFPDTTGAYSFAVIGSGQSAGEVTEHLLETYPSAQIDLIIRDFALRPIDDSPFVNEIFLSTSRELFYNSDPAFRENLLDDLYNTNYAVVDIDVIKRLYGFSYIEKVKNTQRLRIRAFTQMDTAKEFDGKVELELHNIKDSRSEKSLYDGAIMAMGYRRKLDKNMLSELQPYLYLNEQKQLHVDRDYSLRTSKEIKASIFVQGFSEDYHGISDTLLSLLPIRSLEICQSMKKKS